MSKKAAKQIQEEVELDLQAIGDFAELMKKEDWEIGIDEAGRGPVLGPMVYGSALWPIKYKDILAKKGGFNDSKQLSEKQRESMFTYIKTLKGVIMDYELKILTPQYLSNEMTAYIPNNLNSISHQSAISLIQSALDQGYNITQCYLDTVGPKLTYQIKLQDHFRGQYPNLKFQVEEKADSKFKVVSAASICAKVTRDHEMIAMAQKYKDTDVGSGYPADPNTKKWLQRNFIPGFGFGDIIRYSWATTKNLMEAQGLHVEYQSDAAIEDEMDKLNYQVRFRKVGMVDFQF